MATKTFNTRVANKRDTSSNWTTNNPVLLNGEIIIVDTEAGQVRYKVGNGTSTYTQLPFTDESLITNINGKLSLTGGTMTGNIAMGGHKVTGLGAPTNANDAVRQADLKVVSDEVDGIISGTTGITLAPATTTKIGGVIVGDGIEVEEDGTISVTPGLTQEQADERYLQLSGGTMTGALTLNGEPTEDLQAATKQYVDALKPLTRAITLTAAGWSGNAQTVTVSGVSGREFDQLITPTPAIASQTAYYEAGIMCTGQPANSLTFTCRTVPTSNLNVYVVIQPLS